MSDLAKIAASQKPARRRSRLEPYLDELRKLQNDGYSLEQMRTFLAEIGVIVSRQSIYDFLKRREAVAAKALPVMPPVAEEQATKPAASKDQGTSQKVRKAATAEELKAISRSNVNMNQYLEDE